MKKHFLKYIIIVFVICFVKASDFWLKIFENGNFLQNFSFQQQIAKNIGVHIKMKDSDGLYFNIPTNEHFFFTITNNEIISFSSRDIELKRQIASFNLRELFSIEDLGDFKEGDCIMIKNSIQTWILCADTLEEKDSLISSLQQIKENHTPIKQIIDNAVLFPIQNNHPLYKNIRRGGIIQRGDDDLNFKQQENQIKTKMKQMLKETEQKIQKSREKLIEKLNQQKLTQELKQREEAKNLLELKKNSSQKIVKKILQINPYKCTNKSDNGFIISFCKSHYTTQKEFYRCTNKTQFCYYCCAEEAGLLGEAELNNCYDQCGNSIH